jgi:hypothetical protein
MNTTGKQLVEHWTWAAERGQMNRNTAGALRTACLHVLGVQDNWEQIDVTSLDVDDLIRRFQNLRAREFNPASLNAYARRFRNAVTSFLEYTKNPAGWKPSARPPKVGTNSDGRATSRAKETAEDRGDTEQPTGDATPAPSVKGLIEYPFPLRENLVARLMLPRDISAAEAKRLYGFMMALAVDSAAAE